MGRDARFARLIEDTARTVAERYAINEIRVPVLERRDLYERSSGETSDVVQKQLFTIQRGPESESREDQVLRPEGTPGVIRAYIEAGLDRSDPEQRYYYLGPMFRYERPQKGRFRQFHQFGVEIFGRADAVCDAELLIMIEELRRELGLELEFQINSLGDAQCRPAFRAALLEYGREHWTELCADCHQRLERNPLRLLDCKIDVEIAAHAPSSLDNLCTPCREHFATVERLLGAADVAYVVNPRLVRGLDYYTRTAFEIVSGAIGSQSAVIAGGRYDGLVESLGGAAIAGVGFAIGIERLALAAAAVGEASDVAPHVAMVALGEGGVIAALSIAQQMRSQALRVELLSPDRGLKALLRRASKIGARFAVIIGENEVSSGTAQLRDLAASAQREVPTATAADIDRLTEEIRDARTSS